MSPEQLAQRFHETYERLAPSFGYETRIESAKPWAEVPEQNRALMTAVCAEIIAAGWLDPHRGRATPRRGAESTMTTTLPPDRRPYRAQHEPGDERVTHTLDSRQRWRQVGWHGQSGAFYSLAEDPSRYEPASFSPLWLLIEDEPPIVDEQP